MTSRNEPGLRELSTTEVDAVAGAGLWDLATAIYRALTMKGPQV